MKSKWENKSKYTLHVANSVNRNAVLFGFKDHRSEKGIKNQSSDMFMYGPVNLMLSDKLSSAAFLCPFITFLYDWPLRSDTATQQTHKSFKHMSLRWYNMVTG